LRQRAGVTKYSRRNSGRKPNRKAALLKTMESPERARHAAAPARSVAAAPRQAHPGALPHADFTTREPS
jgi:hypothetical protein